MAFVARADRPGMPGIRRVGIKHEAILNFLLANPKVQLGKVAEHFNVSQPWLSLIIHSDAFQRKLRERQDIHFHTSILPIMDKVAVAAEAAIDRMIQLIPIETDVGKLNQIADKALNRLGYGTSNVQKVETEVYVQDRTALENARALIGVKRPPAQLVDASTLEVEYFETESTGKGSAGQGGAMGQDDQGAPVSATESDQPQAEAGGAV